MATHSFLQEVARKHSIDNLESDVLKKFTSEQLEKLDPVFDSYADSKICPSDLLAYSASNSGVDVDSEVVIFFLKGVELGKQLKDNGFPPPYVL